MPGPTNWESSEYPHEGYVKMNMKHSALLSFLFLITVWLTMAVPQLLAENHALTIEAQTDTEVSGVLKVMGKGLPPSTLPATSKEARILARQAAIIDSYRNMVALVSEVRPYLIEGAGEIVTEGYIKGARVTQTRYMENGWVQVDLELSVSLLPAVHGSMETINTSQKPGLGAPVRVVNLDQEIYEIDKTEWEELVGNLQKQKGE